MGEVGVTVYGDLTAGRLVRVMRRSADENAGWQLRGRSNGAADFERAILV